MNFFCVQNKKVEKTSWKVETILFLSPILFVLNHIAKFYKENFLNSNVGVFFAKKIHFCQLFKIVPNSIKSKKVKLYFNFRENNWSIGEWYTVPLVMCSNPKSN